MTEQAQTSTPSQFAFQSGALQGIVNGQSDNWFVGNTTASIEEVEDAYDEWVTEEVGTDHSGTQIFAIDDAPRVDCLISEERRSSAGAYAGVLHLAAWLSTLTFFLV